MHKGDKENAHIKSTLKSNKHLELKPVKIILVNYTVLLLTFDLDFIDKCYKGV